MPTSGQELRDARVRAGISMRGMARRTGVSYSHLSNVERGDRTATAPLVETYRRVLADKGHTLDGPGGRNAPHGGHGAPYAAGPLATVPALTAVERVRTGLQDVIGRRTRTEWWQQAVAEYGTSHYLTPPAEQLRDLLADVPLLEEHIEASSDADRRSLLRWAAYLAGIAALAWSNVGERRQARRWWATAFDAADQAEDPVVRVWVRAWAVTNGPSIGRGRDEMLAMAGEWLGGDLAADGASCALLGGLAQTQADVGDPAAVTTLRRLADLVERVPGDVVADRASLFGWPEVRLRYAESYVHTARRETAAAYAAQDRALRLYDADLARDRVKVLLHRARCLIIDGDISGGAAYAADVLDGLDATVRCPGVTVAAAAVLAAVPPRARKLAGVAVLHERLTAK